MIADRERIFQATPELDARVDALRRQPYFREATPDEIDPTHAAYQAGDLEGLVATWQRVASPTRAELPGAMRWAYAQAGKGPRIVNALVFLVTLRAVLRAGERFRDTLAPAVREAIHTEFPWLERRHEHVPEGFTPRFEFPLVFREFLEWGDLDDSRARWQLAVGLNEVQQFAYSSFAAEHFCLPELHRHAARERAMAINYFRHWSPKCSKQLWRETIVVLDALNAAVFELVCRPHGVFAYAMQGALTQRGQWQAFVAGLDTPQWLLAPE
ncbi:hypothetical protein ACNOYE_14075 [Nannocystaceae bacterium ST9]